MRASNARTPAARTACRTAKAVTGGGTGGPNATVTVRRRPSGRFVKNLPPLKLKMLPQRLSR